MAKAKQEAENLYEGLTAEEVAMMLKMTGQSNNSSYERAPTLKINLSSKRDKEGKNVEVGNFVIGQSIKLVDGAKVVESIGKDYGPNPEVTILKVAQQYNYYSPSKEARCSSQLLTEMKEVPVGYNLKHECNSGKCPRRQKDIPKDDKCTCQYVVYLEMAEDKERCIIYLKGASFMPFKAYLDSVGSDPMFFFPTIFKTKEKSQGSVDYYEIWPEIDKSRPYPLEVRKENMQKLSGVSKEILAFKASQTTQTKSITYAEAEVVGGADEGFSDITF